MADNDDTTRDGSAGAGKKTLSLKSGSGFGHVRYVALESHRRGREAQPGHATPTGRPGQSGGSSPRPPSLQTPSVQSRPQLRTVPPGGRPAGGLSATEADARQRVLREAGARAAQDNAPRPGRRGPPRRGRRTPPRDPRAGHPRGRGPYPRPCRRAGAGRGRRDPVGLPRGPSVSGTRCSAPGAPALDPRYPAGPAQRGRWSPRAFGASPPRVRRVRWSAPPSSRMPAAPAPYRSVRPARPARKSTPAPASR